MGEYADLGGVRIWYEEQGVGEPLVLLNGGLCTNETWAPQIPALAGRFRVYALEHRGHGHTADVAGAHSYDDNAADAIGFLESVVGGPAHVVGFSDGGNVGLLMAIARPDLVRKLVTLGANYDTSGLIPETEEMLAAMTNPDSDEMAMFRALYAASSPDGPEHWPVVLAKVMKMWEKEPHIPVSDLARIECPTLVLTGDDDMVTLEHSIELYRAIPKAELCVVPGASHLVAMEKAELVNGLIVDFLTKEGVVTMIPFRRATAHPH
jgi:pimeloyl-ACP methyl ester carboxylesterase